jgi:hypothetical protein
MIRRRCGERETRGKGEKGKRRHGDKGTWGKGEKEKRRHGDKEKRFF